MGQLEESVKRYAQEMGFDVVGITTADAFLRDERVSIERVRKGFMDGLPWYTEERIHHANHPKLLLNEARSVISLAMSYLNQESSACDEHPRGKIARYAWGDDYHHVLKKRLKEFVDGLRCMFDKPIKSRIFVDDGPMNDRAAAERAGVGWFGKNTNILTPSHGSWVLLGQVITDLNLVPDEPLKKNCGNCVRCIDDCPTGAIVAPYVIDNTKCISFLTIELRGIIPRELRPLIGDWVFGCDICQEVCPVNLKASLGREPSFQQRHDFATPQLIPLLELDDQSFAKRFHASPIKRARRAGLQRNVCVALGNKGDVCAVPALNKILCSGDSMVRVHAAWALGQIGGSSSSNALESALGSETDPDVTEEILLALSHLSRIDKTVRSESI